MPAGEKNPELSTNESWNRLNGERGWKDMRAQQTHPTECAVLDPNAGRDSLAMHSSGGISSHIVMCQNHMKPKRYPIIAGEWNVGSLDIGFLTHQNVPITSLPFLPLDSTGTDFISLWGFTGRVLSARWASPVALDLQRVLSSPPGLRSSEKSRFGQKLDTRWLRKLFKGVSENRLNP